MTIQSALAGRATGTLLLHELFEAQAVSRPDAVAVVFGPQQITYAQLESRANQIARHLQRRGVGRGSVVAMLLPRSIDAYAAILGILKSGAAYVPIDPDYPADRIDYILSDSGASALVTASELAAAHTEFPGAVVRIDTNATDASAIAAESSASLPREQNCAAPEDLCYIIYTSGSTGRPKGVMVEHCNARHLVSAESGIYRVRPEDRVYQGASLSFDLSVEEVWLALHSGATLVAATPEMSHAGPDLGRRLAELGVTVLSCVPTLLSMMAEDVSTLRLIILGGETCSDALVERWARPGRRIVNTYGPTETTVIATYTDVTAGRPVTIGRAVPGYRVYILGEDLRPVPRGQAGEICIGGAGVTRGYIGRPAETAARFVPDPFGGEGARLYRSGDLGRIDTDGDIHFLGRADGQVKLRGLRIELSEIESVMLEAPDVLAAACTVHENGSGVQQLTGYVVPRDGRVVDEDRLIARLRKQLPGWMVPALIETAGELPLLPCGKLDRASLPQPRPRAGRQNHSALPLTAAERKLLDVWSALFHPLPVALDDDFFLDLGGHSLLVAQLVSKLRKDPQFASVAVVDVYKHPTVTRLAAALDQRDRLQPVQSTQAAACSRTRHFIAGALQSASLYFIFGFRGIQAIAPFLVYFLTRSALWAAVAGILVFPVLLLLAIAAKWLLLGRIQSGRHPLWGGYYLRWWFVQTLVESLPLTRLGGTPLLPFVYRLFGARIGSNVHLATSRLAAFDLISIGDGTSVDEGAAMDGHTVEGGELVIGAVSVGRGCSVGTRAVLCPDTAMEDGARLEDLSLLPRGEHIPAGETWAGSPPRRIDRSALALTPPLPTSRLSHTAAIAFYAAAILVLPLVELSACVPGVAILTALRAARGLFWLAAPAAGASFICCLMAEVVLLKWVLVGRVRAGCYPVHGWFYRRNWVVEQLLALTVEAAGSLHATLYLKPWYRALGARLGRSVELSTASITTPDLLEIEEGGTVADEASLSGARVENGWLTLAPIRIGRRAFVGNNAVVPAGITLGDDSLVGVLSVAPSFGRAACSGASWLGSPAIRLPRRQQSAAFGEQRTFRPSRALRIARAICEIPRVTLPSAAFIAVTLAVIEAAIRLWDRVGPAATLLLLPAIYTGGCGLALLGVAAIKWIVIGRYQPFEQPLWSTFLWRLEFVNAMFEFLATPLALDALQGTPLLPWYLRLMGARIGRGVWIWSTGFLEWDLVDIGDGAVLNQECILQTHLFEDRVLKASRVRIGAGCEIGGGAVVLYDSEMQAGSRLGALSLVMKGETLPAGTSWVGSPLAASVGAECLERAGAAVA